MKQILLFVTIISFHFTVITQSQKDSLNKVVQKRIKDIKQSQSDNPYYTKEEKREGYAKEVTTFQALAQPTEDSDLANYFKIYLEKKLLQNIDFSTIGWSSFYKHPSKNAYSYTIRLTFEISKTNKATNCRINTGNKERDRKIIEIFKKYPLEKLGLKESDKLGKISVQLFAKEDKNVIIKANKFAVVDTPPILKDCENAELYWQINKCLYDKLYEHILKNLSLKTLNNQELRGEVIFNPRFTINEEGKIVHVNSIAPNQIIKDEIDRVIQSFSQVIIPGKRNGNPQNTYCDTYRSLTIENIK
ncbi:hypothetical protein K6T82_02965 [Flavobacterium sp. 17A]|uniref:Uncharacterized protein n=1 Tax=Flavobacterium potami TaxID=2872310 RepID=A0A9X1H860_9FLAO|nr:hypothetical protein [Flavobacterium potami]MBZ4033709.1 hypothetical protein [Flavobacterium potami]